MAESTETPPVAPPKKRSFFKKAAWQTTAKEEPGKEKDIFSHSNEYKDVVAEQTKQRLKEKKEKAVREEKKRRADEARDSKKRKLSVEDDDEEVKMPSSGSQGSGKRKRESKERSNSPFSPSTIDGPIHSDTHQETLSSRYESVAKHTRSNSKRVPHYQSNVVDLGDSDSDDPSSLPKPSKSALKPKPAPAPSDDIEEVEDPYLAALAAQARERQRMSEAAQSASPQADTPTANGTAKPASPPVQLLITSDIEGTQPLQVKIRLNAIVDRPRLAWCEKQGLTPAQTRNVFLTWKSKRLAGTTTIRRLGIKEENGEAFLEDDPSISTDELPKIHVEAWTEETFKEAERRKKEEAEAKKKAAELPPVFVEEEPTAKPEPEAPKIRLHLKAMDKEVFKIQVKPDTTIEHLTTAYKKSRKVADDEPVTLMFDGARLSPMDTITDAEIEDMDTIEVHFK
ncbi:ubiquitin-2 like Rad60 SUMO-like-domain-containing protein [Lophiotrema nucula]|uniref:Ubiquitin-2 like Rad60 SUMO-like-domain-containing protein n=1 Tax=Lophiotrema nucula TaxID=690887 RepID=A0A6A5YYX6_9PLEO|nr:ubiquitin-2 like Rad60 SUMO-like-domain-containing protein [Lophiotrema nucula]